MWLGCNVLMFSRVPEIIHLAIWYKHKKKAKAVNLLNLGVNIWTFFCEILELSINLDSVGVMNLFP